MLNKIPLSPVFALLLAPLSSHAAVSGKAEYETVRKIALRDPKVRAAYAEADRKLDQKILQIDPSLAPYIRQRSNSAPESSAPPAPKPAPKPSADSSTVRPFRRAHTVVKGDTLGSIAIKYGVSIASLKSANNITDERKLAVGHVLAIPNK